MTIAAQLLERLDPGRRRLISFRARSERVERFVVEGGHRLEGEIRPAGNKNAALVPMIEILDLTGYIRGGCSPLGMKKNYPLYIDETVTLQSHVFVSAGVRGLQLKIATADLLAVTNGIVCDLV